MTADSENANSTQTPALSQSNFGSGQAAIGLRSRSATCGQPYLVVTRFTAGRSFTRGMSRHLSIAGFWLVAMLMRSQVPGVCCGENRAPGASK